MILKGTSKHRSFSIRSFPIILLLSILLALVAIKFYSSDAKPIAKEINTTISCSAENRKDDKLIGQNGIFENGELQTDKRAHTGKYSIQLDEKNKYGFTYFFDDFAPGDSYKINAWSYTKFKTKGVIAILGKRKNGKDFYQQSGKNVFVDGNWWQKHEIIFTVPKSEKIDNLKVYVYTNNAKGGPIFFDDFSITKLDSIEMAQLNFNVKHLNLHLDKKALDQLEKIRKKAFTDGILIRSGDEYVQGKIVEGEETQNVKVRYKGDWLDHLMGSDPSYRIQTKSDNSWNHVQTFSIQHPKTRGYLREWFYHEFLRQFDILSPRYDFISFQVNKGQSRVMAFEEHFNKNLLENQLRREGPILKFTEDRFWEGIKRSLAVKRELANMNNKSLAYWSSEIKPFKESKIRKSPTLSGQFAIAQNLLNDYKYGIEPPEKVFDLTRMAKFVAIVDLFMAYHSMTWHNQRFYYNPVTALLEPIAYDGNGDERYRDPLDYPILARRVYESKPSSPEPIDRLFYSEKFVEKYVQSLMKFTDLEYLSQFTSQFDEQIDLRVDFLKTQFKDYKFDKKELVNRAKHIKTMLEPFSNSLQIFKKQSDQDSVQLEIKNTHILPLKIIGIGNKKLEKAMPYSMVIFPQPISKLPSYVQIAIPKNAKYIHYKLVGSDKVYSKSIAAWSSPSAWSPRNELIDQAKLSSPKPYIETGDVILFEKKTYDFDQPIIIEAGKNVIVEPGTTFNFKNGAFLLSYSPIDFRGDSDEPILINGIDDKSGAIVVLQASGVSFLRNVIFKHQNTMKYKGWNLTGAVTFYESDVDVLNSQFTHNLCEDALNIVRSNFTVEGCHFDHIFSDAFDADYSKGKTRNTHFNIIGNDALDFSTSEIEIDQCRMKTIGDKGISAGEQATITANNIEVDGGNIGFASKDLSVLRLDNISVSNCKKGVVAYQKKPEYGPAKIILGKYSFKNVRNEFLIEAKSELIK